jgi:raffinose/stachyose/melibiose transport system permease protein
LKQQQVYPFYFILPVLVLYLALFIGPGILGILYSFTDWNRYSDEVNFVGLQNFREMFTSTRNYTGYLLNTLQFTVISNVVKLVPALFLAILLSEGVRGKNVYRAILFFPAVLSFLVIGLVFRSILHPTTGFLNQVLRAIGLDIFAKRWLVTPGLVWPSVFAVDAWRGIGYVMTIFIAGLQTIPRSFYEAADIDGARFFAKLRHITLPMLVPAITVNVIFGLTYGLKVFDIVYVLTGGGPGRMTEVLNTAVLKEFADGMYGMGTALSTILFVFMALAGFFIIRFMNKRAVEV